jgi:hypothetical protein
MKKPVQNQSKLRKLILIICMLVVCSATASYAQNKVKPIDDAIAIAAPHLPAVEKFKGSGTSFQFEKQAYKYDEKPIKDWITAYPTEFPKYNVAIQKLIKETKVSDLSPGMQSIYNSGTLSREKEISMD